MSSFATPRSRGPGHQTARTLSSTAPLASYTSQSVASAEAMRIFTVRGAVSRQSTDSVPHTPHYAPQASQSSTPHSLRFGYVFLKDNDRDDAISNPLTSSVTGTVSQPQTARPSTSQGVMEFGSKRQNRWSAGLTTPSTLHRPRAPQTARAASGHYTPRSRSRFT